MNERSFSVSNEDRKRFLEEHFKYEVDMFMLSGNLLIEAKKGNNSDVRWGVGMVAFECLLLHARNLIEFFYIDKKKYPDDALASDFYDEDKQWRELRPEATESINTTKTRIGKELAHLTYIKNNRDRHLFI